MDGTDGGGRRRISLALKIVISTGLLSYLFYRIGFTKFIGTVGSIDPLWLGVSIAVLTISNITGSIQWYLLLRGSGIPVAFRRTLSYYYTGLFFNNFLLGFVGGDLFRVYDIVRHSGNHGAAFSTVFLDRLIGVFVMCLLAFVMLFFTIDFVHIGIIVIPLFIGLGMLILVSLFFYFKTFAKKFQGFGERILPVSVQMKVREIYNAINYFRYHKALLARLILISTATQSLRIMTHYCVALSMNIDIAWQVYFVLIPVISLVTMIPISIGGLGVREQSGVVLFRFVGLAAPQAFIMQLLAYVVNIICSVPGGGSFIFRKHGRAT